MLAWLKKLFSMPDPARSGDTVTYTCRFCGKTFTLPENVQHWPDACPACRARYRPEETISRVCPRCGKTFTFSSSVRRWPSLCGDCREARASRRGPASR